MSINPYESPKADSGFAAQRGFAEQLPIRMDGVCIVVPSGTVLPARLDRLDQACRGLVITGCFDEIFFHGKPVLVGVEPHSMAWVLGTHAADRSASTWTGALQGFNALEQAVVDGGRGMQRGLADFQTQRKNAGNATPLQVSLDVFHTKQEAQRVLRKLWSRVDQPESEIAASRNVHEAGRHVVVSPSAA